MECGFYRYYRWFPSAGGIYEDDYQQTKHEIHYSKSAMVDLGGTCVNPGIVLETHVARHSKN